MTLFRRLDELRAELRPLIADQTIQDEVRDKADDLYYACLALQTMLNPDTGMP